MKEIAISLKLAINVLRSNKGRTILSLLGIVIGVTAVILVLSLGAGLKQFVVDQVESFGTDLFEIEIKVPNVDQQSSQNAGGLVGGTQITTFKLEDAEKVAEIPFVDSWYGGNIGQEVLSYRQNNKQAMIMAMTPGIIDADDNFKIDRGTMYGEDDERSLNQVVLLGSDLSKDLFGQQNAVGKNVKIRGQSYKVIGVLRKRGSVSFFSFDDMAYMPANTFHKKLMGIDYITFAFFRVKDSTKMDQAVYLAKKTMSEQHDINDPSEEDFAVMSMSEASDMLDQVFAVVNILLLSLTSVSLIVGGVGITNVMYVAVAERTFEIGLRKSVGAKRSDILKQFLFEAIILTLLGGIGGVLIGFGIAQIAQYFIGQFGYSLQFPLTLSAFAIAMGFSAVTGLIFGLRPAQSASRMSPMEALRKE